MAIAGVRLGATRATTCDGVAPRSGTATSGDIGSTIGIQRSHASGNEKPRGITATTVYDCPPRRMVWFTMSRPPYCRRQKA